VEETMTAPKRGTREASFAAIVAAFRDDRSVGQGRMFGAAGLEVHGKVFAMLVGGRLVAKLPAARVDEIIEAGSGERFDPGHGKRMKEWVAVPEGALVWLDIASEAYRFVKGGSA
jgi:hypothetical protein